MYFCLPTTSYLLRNLASVPRYLLKEVLGLESSSPTRPSPEGVHLRNNTPTVEISSFRTPAKCSPGVHDVRGSTSPKMRVKFSFGNNLKVREGHLCTYHLHQIRIYTISMERIRSSNMSSSVPPESAITYANGFTQMQLQFITFQGRNVAGTSSCESSILLFHTIQI